ncbi:YibE/F-like protein [Pelagirhabdus alkalitolerans]|uniref:YibE/F-like protein n=1 Tax=Pelagirhabdus alkalitolerans TaxID=1612202 RepID=A0A1G6GML1_9BACI|nr:YibE/F family protein [Pelagirhabdus alkalitolerans]SDB83207.1 YibE/F-like protein [Pelagirhabdus alkalitolerans]
MNALMILTLILFGLMVAIGGMKGLRSFIALFINFFVILLMTLMMIDQNANPVYLALAACVVISAVTLFFINESNVKTKTAFLATVLTTLLLVIFIQFMVEFVMVGGFSDEEVEGLTIYNFYVGINFVQVMASVVMMSTIGAVVDEAISISSPMYEIHRHHPDMSVKELFDSGMRIGRDLLGTSANTLFFAFFGGYLALLVRFKDFSYSFGQMLNAKVFSAEMVTILAAGIGVALIVPVTSILTAYILVRQQHKNKESTR